MTPGLGVKGIKQKRLLCRKFAGNIEKITANALKYIDVRVQQHFRGRQYKRLLPIFAGAVFLVSAAAVAAPRFQQTEAAKQTQSKYSQSNQVAAETTSPATKETTSTKPDSPETKKSQTNSTTMPTGQNPTEPQALQTPPPLASSGSDKQCAPLIKSLLEQYNKEKATNKSELDSRITYPLPGSSIIGIYIETYNQQSTESYRKYSSEAAASSCTFPIKAPQLLPLDYLPKIL